MKLLVVSQDALAIRVLSTTLAGGVHAIELARDADTALLKLADHRPDCVIADWFLNGIDGVELTRRIRALSGPSIPVVVLSELADTAARAHVLRAGAERFLVKPLYAQQVLGAVQALSESVNADAVTAALDVLQQRLMKHAIWTSHDQLVAECLQGCTGMPFRKSNSPYPIAAASDGVSASLGMVDAATRTEVHYAIRVDRPSGAALAKTILGASADDDALVDLLGELCNNILGQSKTILSADGFQFALAVPGAEKPRALPQDVAATKSTVLKWGNATMLVSIGVRVTQAMLVRARKLSEHMVLMEDAKTPEGALLVPSGTRLTAVTAERLMRRLPNHEFRIATVGR
ncbi:MAG: response regulator [Polyangiaceae bacterium]|nr:response regulator [Polyangiaceae bacterium]